MAGNASYWSHEATFEASPTSAFHARTFVSQHLIDHRLLYLVDPVRLVTSELATNALVHAQTAFSVNLAASDQAVLLTVRDESRALPYPACRPSHGSVRSWAGDCGQRQPWLGDQRERGRFQGGLGILRTQGTSGVLGPLGLARSMCDSAYRTSPCQASATVRRTPRMGIRAIARRSRTSRPLAANGVAASPTCCGHGSSPCSR